MLVQLIEREGICTTGNEILFSRFDIANRIKARYHKSKPRKKQMQPLTPSVPHLANRVVDRRTSQDSIPLSASRSLHTLIIKPQHASISTWYRVHALHVSSQFCPVPPSPGHGCSCQYIKTTTHLAALPRSGLDKECHPWILRRRRACL